MSAPTGDTSTPHSDWTLTRDPFNVTLTYTIADLHLWRSRSRLLDVDFLADPSASISVGLDEPHAAAGGAAVNLFLVHVKQNGDSFLDLGAGPSVGFDGSSATVSGQGTAELHLDATTSLTFTATFTPTPGPDGLGLNSTEVFGFMKHF